MNDGSFWPNADTVKGILGTLIVVAAAVLGLALLGVNWIVGPSIPSDAAVPVSRVGPEPCRDEAIGSTTFFSVDRLSCGHADQELTVEQGIVVCRCRGGPRGPRPDGGAPSPPPQKGPQNGPF